MSKKTVAIFAPTGMLGNQVYAELKDNFNLILVYRDEQKLKLLHQAHGGVELCKQVKFDLEVLYEEYKLGFPQQHMLPSLKNLFAEIGEVDTVINCAGVIKPHSLKKPELTLFINGVIPHILSSFYKEKLIQITTDCAFSGIQGAPYSEVSEKTPNDLYGLSKSLGEPFKDSLVLRTSIIGPELGEGNSLIAWFLKQQGQTIKGFTNHFWNGITTKQFGQICKKIILNRNSFPKSGLFHIFSNSVSKYDMVVAFKEKYKIDVNIEKAEPAPVDRRLATEFELCKQLEIPSFEQMVKEM